MRRCENAVSPGIRMTNVSSCEGCGGSDDLIERVDTATGAGVDATSTAIATPNTTANTTTNSTDTTAAAAAAAAATSSTTAAHTAPATVVRIDDSYVVDEVGLVVQGTVHSGAAAVSSCMHLGPDQEGQYHHVTISSTLPIHDVLCVVRCVCARARACVYERKGLDELCVRGTCVTNAPRIGRSGSMAVSE